MRLVHSGYFPKGTKTHASKAPPCQSCKDIFKDTGIIISTEGERYLGGAVGASSFIHVHQYAEREVECRMNKLEKLSKFAESQSHTAHAAFTQGLLSKWNYHLRVTDWAED